MARSKFTVPGSIFKRKSSEKLYINFRGVQYSTGLKDTKQGRKLALTILENMYLDYRNLRVTNAPVTFAEAWEQYAASLVNVAEKTITCYKTGFDKFIINPNEYLTSTSIEKAVIIFMNKYHSNHNLSKVSVNTYLNVFQLFINFCSRAPRKWIDMINYKTKYSLKTEQRLAQSYSPFECYQLIKYFYAHDIEIAYLIFFMIETGARVVDALTLEWSQVDFDNKSIRWKNKISKLEEIRPASNTAIHILQRLKQMNTSKVFQMKYNYTQPLLLKLRNGMRELNIPRQNRRYQEFRVTFRMNLKLKGIDEHVIEYMLRHSTGNIMENHYTDYNVLFEKIREQINKPLNYK